LGNELVTEDFLVCLFHDDSNGTADDD
jgi:hypothetical protein